MESAGAFGADREKSNQWTDIALLVLVFGMLFFLDLGETNLVNPDEGRYAEIPREMLASGDYVTPRLNGVLYFEKPPLVYWLVAGSMALFGHDEMGMRSVPALFALAGVLLTYVTARRLYGREAGLAAATVLGSSLLFFALGRILLLDMALSVLMSVTLCCFILAMGEPAGWRRRGWFYGLYAAAALATLTKGLIGFLVPGAVMFLWLLIFNQWRQLRPLYLPSGIALFLAIAAPWHVLAAQRNPVWAHFYFVREHWQRFTTTEHGRYEPFWFFIPIVLMGLFPWVGCVVPALRQALAGGWARRRENATGWFFVTWIVFVFLFFSKSQSKLIPYILPVFPPFALLIGAWFVSGARTDPRRYTAAVWGFVIPAVIIGGAMLAVGVNPGLIPSVTKLSAWRADALVGGPSLLIGAVLVPVLMRRRQLQLALVAFVVSVASLYLALAEAQDKLARPGTKEFALLVKAKIQPGDRVYHYHDFFHDFTFYAERTVGTIEAPNTELEIEIDPAAQASGRFIDEAEFRRQWTGPDRLWVVARKREVVGRLFADPDFQYHLLGESPGHYLFSNQP